MTKEKNYRKLKCLIAQSGMTVYSFAQKVGMSQCYLSQIILGERNPSRALDRRIRTALDYWNDDLYDVDVNAAENFERAIIQNLKYWTRVLETDFSAKKE